MGERSGVVMMEEGVLFQAMREEITTCPRGTAIDRGRVVGAGGGGRGRDGGVALSEGCLAWVKRHRPANQWARTILNFSFI
jgi:hypothetical protein